MGVGVYVLAVLSADFGALFVAVAVFAFAGFFVRARFFMARNLQ
jgi:hypothetical protein